MTVEVLGLKTMILRPNHGGFNPIKNYLCRKTDIISCRFVDGA